MLGVIIFSIAMAGLLTIDSLDNCRRTWEYNHIPQNIEDNQTKRYSLIWVGGIICIIYMIILGKMTGTF